MSDKKKLPWILKLRRSTVKDTGQAKNSAGRSDDVKIIEREEDSRSQDQVADDTALPDDTLGLALSGGGIRSATFCLGILQALAKSGWLKRVDIMSTVSGGGYIGAFLGKFFDNSGNSPATVAASLSDSRSREVSWLRSHSNYLSPSGAGDSAFNLVSFWRNLFTVHLVLLIFMFAVLGVANAIAYWQENFGMVHEIVSPLSPLTNKWFSGWCARSPWVVLTEVLVWLAVLPLFLAYWFVSEDQHEEFLVLVLIAALILALAAALATGWLGFIVVYVSTFLWIIYTWKKVKRLEGQGDPESRFKMALGRNFLTNLLAFWAAVTLGTFAISLIDLAGRYLAEFYLENGGNWAANYGLFGGTASLIGLIPLLRGLANFLASKGSDQNRLMKLVTRIPFVPAAAAILVGAFLPLTIVAFLSHLTFEVGEARAYGTAAAIVAVVVSVLLGRFQLVQFVNRSSMLTVYGARLARVFLGAVNPTRHRHPDGKDIGHVIEGDDLPLGQYEPHKNGGPLHLINVAVNETVDVASQRGIRDRKAENMAVGPAGINVAKDFHAVWAKERSCPEEQTNHSPSTNKLQPVGNLTIEHPLLNNDRSNVPVEELNLREWIGISGAAFSPGMGRGTSLARSLLYTLTNLRIGYWWDSGILPGDRFRIPMKSSLFGVIRNFCYRAFAPHVLLLAECLGRFGGPWRRHWYLSDGGHFELTGAYELIRRRVPYIVVVDVGADPKNEGQVLAWLVRLTRIDFGAKFTEVSPTDPRVPEAMQQQLGTVSSVFCGETGKPERQGILFEITYEGQQNESAVHWKGRTSCFVLYLRAAMLDDEPVDVRNYKFENPEFPNEATLDQFFDEPQWESYRKLGEHIGDKFFV